MNERHESLLDYLKKPSGYMTIIILIITIIATICITSYFQDRTEITIQESQYDFFTKNGIDKLDINQHITVYYNDKEILNPHVIKITISNTGNQEITEDSFKSDMFEISFSENTILYDASIPNATSKNVREEIASKLEIKDNRLLISPFLINADEFFTLTLITNQASDIFYDFRLVGISNTKKELMLYNYEFFLPILITVFSFLSVLSIMMRPKKASGLCILSYKLITLIMAIFVLASMLTYISLLSTSIIKAENTQQFIFK